MKSCYLDLYGKVNKINLFNFINNINNYKWFKGKKRYENLFWDK